MRINALGRHAIHAAHMVLQEVQRQPDLPDPLQAAAGIACIGYPNLTMVRHELWTDQQDDAMAWWTALCRARLVLDQLLELEADPDIRSFARWANRHFPTRHQLTGGSVVHVPGRGWTVELAE